MPASCPSVTSRQQSNAWWLTQARGFFLVAAPPRSAHCGTFISTTLRKHPHLPKRIAEWRGSFGAVEADPAGRGRRELDVLGSALAVGGDIDVRPGSAVQ